MELRFKDITLSDKGARANGAKNAAAAKKANEAIDTMARFLGLGGKRKEKR